MKHSRKWLCCLPGNDRLNIKWLFWKQLYLRQNHVDTIISLIEVDTSVWNLLGNQVTFADMQENFSRI